jgi:hypothetical protein
VLYFPLLHTVHRVITSQLAAVVTYACCRANSKHPIYHTRYQHIVIGYGLDVPGSKPGRDGEFVFSQKVRSGCGEPPASYSVGSAASFLWVKGVGGVRLTTLLHLVLVLRISGAFDTKNTPPPTPCGVFYTFWAVPSVCLFGNSTRVPPAASYIPHSLSTATLVPVLAEGTVVNSMYVGKAWWMETAM